MTAQPQPLPAGRFPLRAVRPLPEIRPFRLAAGLAGSAALVAMVVLSLDVVGAATTLQPGLLVPSARLRPHPWMAGPFTDLGHHLSVHGIEHVLIALGVLYLVAFALARWVPTWLALSAVVVLTVVFTLAPPIFSTDIFNYVNYARLGVVHHINPYQHGAAAFPTDPSYLLTGHRWRHTPTAYGPLFTLLSYAFAWMGVAGTMWALKAVGGMAALGCTALIWTYARRLGMRPLPAVLLFALNPLVLVYAVGGGHNDLLMALLLLAGALLISDGRLALGGALLAAAAAIKLTAGIALPFVLVASQSRWRVLAGAAGAGAAFALVGYAVFGSDVFGMVHVLSNHAKFLSPLGSVPGYIGNLIGAGGLTPSRQTLFQIVFAAGAAALLGYAWRRRNWLPAAGGALLLLVATSSWILPWYVVWPLALVPLARRRWLTVTLIAVTAAVIALEVNGYNRELRHTERTHARVSYPGPQVPPPLPRPRA